jgi:antitoxin CptB
MQSHMDDIAIRKKRALYRATHRGTKELDILLGKFAQSAVAAMSEAELTNFEEFLALPDPEIDQWMRGSAAPDGVADMVSRVRAFHGLAQ